MKLGSTTSLLDTTHQHKEGLFRLTSLRVDRWMDPDGHDPEEQVEPPDPPQGQGRGTTGTSGVPIPLGPGVTLQEAQQTAQALKALWEFPDPYL